MQRLIPPILFGPDSGPPAISPFTNLPYMANLMRFQLSVFISLLFHYSGCSGPHFSGLFRFRTLQLIGKGFLPSDISLIDDEPLLQEAFYKAIILKAEKVGVDLKRLLTKLKSRKRVDQILKSPLLYLIRSNLALILNHKNFVYLESLEELLSYINGIVDDHSYMVDEDPFVILIHKAVKDLKIFSKHSNTVAVQEWMNDKIDTVSLYLKDYNNLIQDPKLLNFATNESFIEFLGPTISIVDLLTEFPSFNKTLYRRLKQIEPFFDEGSFVLLYIKHCERRKYSEGDLANIFKGIRSELLKLRENAVRSEFKLLFDDILNGSLNGNYKNNSYDYDSLIKLETKHEYILNLIRGNLELPASGTYLDAGISFIAYFLRYYPDPNDLISKMKVDLEFSKKVLSALKIALFMSDKLRLKVKLLQNYLKTRITWNRLVYNSSEIESLLSSIYSHFNVIVGEGIDEFTPYHEYLRFRGYAEEFIPQGKYHRFEKFTVEFPFIVQLLNFRLRFHPGKKFADRASGELAFSAHREPKVPKKYQDISSKSLSENVPLTRDMYFRERLYKFRPIFREALKKLDNLKRLSYAYFLYRYIYPSLQRELNNIKKSISITIKAIKKLLDREDSTEVPVNDNFLVFSATFEKVLAVFNDLNGYPGLILSRFERELYHLAEEVIPLAGNLDLSHSDLDHLEDVLLRCLYFLEGWNDSHNSKFDF